MSWLPHSLSGRVAGALVLAAGMVFVLNWLVSRHDAAASRAVATALPREVDRPLPDVVVRLAAVHGVIGLAHQMDSIAAEVAPVVEVLPDGGVVLRRAAPSVAGSATFGAAIVLPAGAVAELDPRSRTTLLDLLQQLIDGRPVPAERLVAIDFPLPARDLAALLAWVP